MIYKYSVNHHVSVVSYISKQFRRGLLLLCYPFMRPLVSSTQCVFVAGCGHSGTTLVTAKLGNHPAVMALGYESGVLQPSPKVFRARQRIKAWLMEANARGKTHLIEKTPKHVHMLPLAFHLVPGAKVVLMVRNPLDNCFSLHERFGDLEYAVERWIMDNEAVLAASNPRSVKIVKYEDLTARPEQCLSEICQFLGLTRDDFITVKDATVYDREACDANMELRREQVRRPIKLVTRKWEGKWTALELERVRTRTMPLARKFGYSAAELTLSQGSFC